MLSLTIEVSFASVQSPEAVLEEPLWNVERETNMVLKNPLHQNNKKP